MTMQCICQQMQDSSLSCFTQPAGGNNTQVALTETARRTITVQRQQNIQQITVNIEQMQITFCQPLKLLLYLRLS